MNHAGIWSKHTMADVLMAIAMSQSKNFPCRREDQQRDQREQHMTRPEEAGSLSCSLTAHVQL